jgi:hypothetical protein
MQRPRHRHHLHLLLTLATARLWSIVWFALVYRAGPWRCAMCASTVEPGHPAMRADGAWPLGATVTLALVGLMLLMMGPAP